MRINSLLQSTSWKITRPLRELNIIIKLIISHLKKMFHYFQIKNFKFLKL